MISEERYKRALTIIKRYSRQRRKIDWSNCDINKIIEKYEYYDDKAIYFYKRGLCSRYACCKVECIKIKKELKNRGVDL